MLYDVENIKRYIPHRYPFLLVDRVLEMQVEKDDFVGSRISGVKAVSFNEAHFQGHFPEIPIMPGVLMLEALAQLGGVLIMNCLGKTPQKNLQLFLTGVEKARFRKPVVPGDLIHLRSKIIKARPPLWVTENEAYVEGKKVAEATLSGTVFELGA